MAIEGEEERSWAGAARERRDLGIAGVGEFMYCRY